MAEVGYQMRDVVDYTVASEEEEPGDGWPYDRILSALAAKPAMTPEELSRTIVDQYVASYSANSNVTQAAVKAAGLKPLASCIDHLAKALTMHLKDSSALSGIVTARAKVQEYSRPYDDYCDLLDLCALLEKNVAHQEVQTACTAVKQAAAAIIVANGCKGSSVAKSTGLSIYFPKKKISPLYGSLDFTKETKWDEFLGAYLKALQP